MAGGRGAWSMQTRVNATADNMGVELPSCRRDNQATELPLPLPLSLPCASSWPRARAGDGFNEMCVVR